MSNNGEKGIDREVALANSLLTSSEQQQKIDSERGTPKQAFSRNRYDEKMTEETKLANSGKLFGLARKLFGFKDVKKEDLMHRDAEEEYENHLEQEAEKKEIMIELVGKENFFIARERAKIIADELVVNHSTSNNDAKTGKIFIPNHESFKRMVFGKFSGDEADLVYNNFNSGHDKHGETGESDWVELKNEEDALKSISSLKMTKVISDDFEKNKLEAA